MRHTLSMENLMIKSFVLTILILSGSTIESFFVNASSLNVREKPDLNAPIINQLPIGTHVDALKTNIKIIFNEKDAFWYELDGHKGFVLENFLVKNISEIKKASYILYMKPDGYETFINYELKLFNNKAILTSYAQYYEPFVGIDIGEYIIDKNKIIIHYTKSFSEQQMWRSPNDVVFDIKENDIKRTEILVWNNQISGFIKNEDLLLLKNKNYTLDTNALVIRNKTIDKDSYYYFPGCYSTSLKIDYKYEYSKKANEFIDKYLK